MTDCEAPAPEAKETYVEAMARLERDHRQRMVALLGQDHVDMWDKIADAYSKLESDIDNPYWEAVRNSIGYEEIISPGPVVRWLRSNGDPESRNDLVKRYAWTVTDPLTVRFVAEHLGPKAIDPMCGSGYWTYLLTQLGVKVRSSDLNVGPRNHWHPEHLHLIYSPARFAENGDQWRYKLVEQKGPAAAYQYGTRGTTLLLSWPPYDQPVGRQILNAYRGEKVVYIGEYWACCGDDELFRILESEWEQTAEHRPVQWEGIRDYVGVYRRRRHRRGGRVR